MNPVPVILKKAISLIGKKFAETMYILTDGKYGAISIKSGVVFTDKVKGEIIDAASLAKLNSVNRYNKNSINTKDSIDQKNDFDSSETKNYSGTDNSRDSGKLSGSVKNNFYDYDYD